MRQSIVGTDPGPDNFSDDANPVFFNNNGTTGLVAPACGAIAQCEDATPDSGEDQEDGGSGGSGAVDFRWLLLLTGISLLSVVRRRGTAG